MQGFQTGNALTGVDRGVSGPLSGVQGIEPARYTLPFHLALNLCAVCFALAEVFITGHVGERNWHLMIRHLPKI
ncbi:hypothetical protein [Actinacidiphila rubida]|uniref:hypothetical protein n=1 Tax=Actinacidiphila rubida TaxID=310780 RepID=UPI001C4070A6|nr:hypothetical protein [Actinacidiphila rubida]